MKEVGSLKPSKPKKALTPADKRYGKAPLIAGILAAVCFIAMSILSRVHPLGEYTILVSDLEAQYAPFLFFYKNHLLSLPPSHLISALSYSFALGAGKNIMGTFGYYLASPLNLLVLLFDASQVNEFVLLLMLIRISLASSFMCLFIRRRAENRHTWWPVLFGIMYAFSSYTTIFLFQIMWLDGYMLLPLLLYFVEDYLEEEKTKGLIITLLLLFLTNYYIAYMAGIFSFIYLLVRMYIRGDLTKSEKPFRKIGKFILTAVFCAMTLCVILIPVGLDTIRNADPTHSRNTANYMSFTAIDLLDQMFNGTPGDFSDVLIGNLPFVFISTVVTVFTVIFFVTKASSKKEKIVYGVCAGLIYLSLAIDALDTAWQVFDSPNWFWHRESFVFMPFFLILAYKLLERFSKVTVREITISTAIVLGALFLAQSLGQIKERDGVFLFNLIFISAIALILILMKRETWHPQLKDMPQILPFLLSLLTVFETAIMGPILSGGVSTMSLHYGFAQDYIDSVLVIEDCANASSILGNSFRSEMEQDGSGKTSAIDDSGAYYGGYNGISLFNSNSNKTFGRFLKQLGYNVNYNYFTAGYSYAAPDTDAFFSIGSVYVRRDYTAARFVAEDGYEQGFKFLVNDDVLPLAFPVDQGAFDFDFYALEKDVTDKDYFSFRQAWYESMFPGSFEGVSYFIPATEVEEEAVNYSDYDINAYINADEDKEEDENVVVDFLSSEKKFDPDDLGVEDLYDASSSLTTIYRTNKSIPMIINYRITAESSDELYMNLSSHRTMNGWVLRVNGERYTGWPESTFYSSIVRIGSFEEGSEINVSIVVDSDSFKYLSVNFAYLDKEAFDGAFSGIDTSSVTVGTTQDGYVSMTSDLTEGQVILTTIPYEDGWTLYVDGVKTDITPYQDALIAIDPGTGHHDIELVFTAPGLKAGAVVSVLGILGLVGSSIIIKKNKQRK